MISQVKTQKPIIALCGSMQFAPEMKSTKVALEKMGWEVLTPNLTEASTEYAKLPLAQKMSAKKNFITAHFEKIRKSEAVLIMNEEKKGVPGYIGTNTLMEIGVAAAFEKKIYLLHPAGNQACSEEVLALQTECLDGDLSKLEK